MLNYAHFDVKFNMVWHFKNLIINPEYVSEKKTLLKQVWTHINSKLTILNYTSKYAMFNLLENHVDLSQINTKPEYYVSGVSPFLIKVVLIFS